ncbi:DUF1853 family protein [bacterium]|nr:DUF1853 family protein [bacterium]MDC1221731.1 DUF1853 family protein [Salibacteraceae bacterium]
MIKNSRITSVLNANFLDSTITGFPTFQLPDLDLKSEVNFDLPSNLRLGHLAEKVVSELINASANFNVLYENVQILEVKRTIGELDFIIENNLNNDIIHLEVAYKFYLYDPSISIDPTRNWIGPNRNDSLVEKLEKLKSRQFPLLQHPVLESMLKNIEISKVKQALCFMHSLFIPFDFNGTLDPLYKPAIKGYYLSLDKFRSIDHSTKNYHLPKKIDWGIDPKENSTWSSFDQIEKQISLSIGENQSALCWQKQGNLYSVFFIVWW